MRISRNWCISRRNAFSRQTPTEGMHEPFSKIWKRSGHRWSWISFIRARKLNSKRRRRNQRAARAIDADSFHHNSHAKRVTCWRDSTGDCPNWASGKSQKAIEWSPSRKRNSQPHYGRRHTLLKMISEGLKRNNGTSFLYIPQNKSNRK